MNFAERDEGDFRIYTGAIEAGRSDGYRAAVVVYRVRGVDGAPVETYRDDNVCGGYSWPTPDAALSFALRKAVAVIRAVPPRPAVELPEEARAALASGGSVGRRRPPPPHGSHSREGHVASI
ncbi:hypothetical protein [Piscinibacter sp.]|jgi:hypothetical protein|uniref:hypothetical protein n=1 Tax=Piscinibacter sp. TaxID=1903157 RepID=UPI00355AA283